MVRVGVGGCKCGEWIGLGVVVGVGVGGQGGGEWLGVWRNELVGWLVG